MKVRRAAHPSTTLAPTPLLSTQLHIRQTTFSIGSESRHCVMLMPLSSDIDILWVGGGELRGRLSITGITQKQHKSVLT